MTFHYPPTKVPNYRLILSLIAGTLLSLTLVETASASTPPPGALDNGDGTYSYVDLDGLQVGDPMTIWPVTYQYAGQVRYRYTPEPPVSSIVTEPSGWVDHAPRAVILSGFRAWAIACMRDGAC